MSTQIKLPWPKSDATIEQEVINTYEKAINVLLEDPLTNYNALQNASFRECLKTLLESHRYIREVDVEFGKHKMETSGDIREHVEKLAQKHTQYAQEKINTAWNALEASLLSPLETLREQAIEQGKTDSLDPKKIEDYKLLDLPVPLKSDEIQKLYNRNWNNEVFVRALKDYERTNRLSGKLVGESVNYTDPYQSAMQRINVVLNRLNSHLNVLPGGQRILADNPNLLQEWDAEINNAYDSAITHEA